jgi:hypothetical protein
MTNTTCGTCRWWQGSADKRLAECRRMPPVSIKQSGMIPWGGTYEDGIYPVWPRLRATDWCGEYTPKGDA